MGESELRGDLERARSYVRERYRMEEDKRYGFLGSSKSKLERFGMPTDYQSTKRMKIGPSWHVRLTAVQ